MANKGNFGHGVTAACAIETIMTIKALHTQTIPAILNLNQPLDPQLNFARENIEKKLDNVVKNSLVFGGINFSFVIKSFQKTTNITDK